ncbi:MAG: glycosyltransferase family 4 protein [Bacteroidales bacterium]|nr:glycosyltransferase family 4 protein [Bacteroidales bacterium]
MGTFDKPEKRTFVFYTAGDYIHTPSTGGTRRYREMLEYFLKAGDEVYLLAPENVDIQNHLHLHHIPIKTYRARILPNGLLNFLLNRRSFRIVKQLNADGVVLFSVPYAIQCIWAGLKSIHLFIREDYMQNIHFRSQIKTGAVRHLMGFKLLLFKLIEKFTLKKSQKIVVQSTCAKNALMDRHPAIWKALEKKTYVLYNNVNTSWILHYSGYIRQMPLHRRGVYYFVFVGTINNRIKGLHLLLEAARYLLDKGYPLQLDVIGDGKLKPEYERMYKDSSGIKFLGRFDEPMRVLSGYDLLILPSLSDSFPNVILEALFLEIPVIGSYVGGIPEMLCYPELLFKPEEKNLAEKLQYIIENDELEDFRQKCIERKRALTFDWGRKAREIVRQ